jgi:hypothetical protein
VKVTDWPGSGAPLPVSVADSTGEFPLVIEVLPVYVTVVGALFSVNVVLPVLGNRVGTAVVSPPNDPVRV